MEFQGIHIYFIFLLEIQVIYSLLHSGCLMGLAELQPSPGK